MIRISIQQTGRPLHEFTTNLTKWIWFELHNDLNNLGDDVHKYMKNYIETHKKRPGGNSNLEKSINLDRWSKGYTVGFGIGNINELNQIAKYWHWINYGIAQTGRKIPPANVGYFGNNFRAPEAGGYGEAWHHTGKGSGFYFMNPKKAIDPMNYIENTNFYLRNQLSKILRRLKKL